MQLPAEGVRTLGASALFAGLGAAAVSALLPGIEWLHVPAGERLLSPAATIDGIYLVAGGRLREESDDGRGTAEELRLVRPGESIGELAALTGAPWTTTVTAVRDSVVARIPLERLDALAERHPRLLVHVARAAAESGRRRERRRDRAEGLSTLAVVPLSRDAPAGDFVASLAAALAASGKVLCVGAADVESRFGESATASDDDSRDAAIDAWLYEQEHDHPLVIYESTAETSSWARHCVAHADRVLVVAYADAGANDSAIAPALFDVVGVRRDAEVELVLLHEDGSEHPRQSAPWLDLFPFTGHHHVRMTSGRDYARLARSLTGRSLGLVLGGGGARGYAHVGVIRALEEAGVVVDRLGGTSIGALIAGRYAAGDDCDAMAESLRTNWANRRSRSSGYTLPLIALLSGREHERALRDAFGDDRIEDLWLPYFCVSANLTRCEPVVHVRGPIVRALRASMSIPGILPPVVTPEGDLLVDGAALNNLPVDIMRRRGSGPVVAVDVSPQVDGTLTHGYRDAPTPWALLRDRVRPNGTDGRFPGIFRILQRSAMLSSAHMMKRLRSETDLFLAPPVAAFDAFDWRALDSIIAAGYEYAAPRIAEWQEREAARGST
jgi:predicted acylesterase/phospholipase RssA/CRP-like cAMP-binding protein